MSTQPDFSTKSTAARLAAAQVKAEALTEARRGSRPSPGPRSSSSTAATR